MLLVNRYLTGVEKHTSDFIWENDVFRGFQYDRDQTDKTGLWKKDGWCKSFWKMPFSHTCLKAKKEGSVSPIVFNYRRKGKLKLGGRCLSSVSRFLITAILSWVNDFYRINHSWKINLSKTAFRNSFLLEGF